MLTIDVENLKVSVDYDGQMTLSCTICPSGVKAIKSAYEDVRDKKLTAVFKQWREKRSIDANAFLWVLCDQIAKKLHSSKEEVYKELVKRVGVFEVVPIRYDAVDTFARMWASRGLGWFVELIDDSKLEGYKKVFIYFGSSSYDSAQMSRLIDEAVHEAESLNIPTIPDEVKKIKEAWGGKPENKSTANSSGS